MYARATIPGYGYNVRIPTRNLCEFCKTSIPVPETSVSYVRLWRNTRGTGISL